MLAYYTDVTCKQLRHFVNSGGDTTATLAQHEQHRFVHIVIDKHKRLLCRPYQVCGKLVGIEYLTLIENTFYKQQPDGNNKQELSTIKEAVVETTKAQSEELSYCDIVVAFL